MKPLSVPGERDALNVAGYGYYPVWFNSETADLTAKKLQRYHALR